MKQDGTIKQRTILLTAAAFIGCAPFAAAQASKPAPPKKPAAPAAKKPAAPPKPITEVKKGDMRIAVTLPALFEATKLTPVKVEPKAWAVLTVKSAVAHGTKVKKGTRLVELDLEKLEEQIEALETAEKSAKLTLQNTLDGLASAEQTTPMQLEAAKRSKKMADVRFDRWLKQGRDREIESYKRSLASSKRMLEYAQEELNQLQKMYDEDDLTEETEEIILKRAKIGVEQAEYYLRRSQDSHDYAMKYGIHQSHQAQLDGHKQATISYELSMRSIPRGLELKRLEVDAAKEGAKKASKKLSDLKRDLDLLKEIKAPADGIVYYGQSINGVWSSAAAAKTLIKGGKLAPKVAFMTIVGDGGLRAQTTLPEDKLAIIKQGARGYATPISNPLLKIPARLGKINYAASPLGFKTTASLELPENSNVMPGMKGSLSFLIADHKGVLTVPVSAVKLEGKKAFVFLHKDGAEAEKREVKLGQTDGKKVLVSRGLAEKDKVLTVAP